MFNNLLFRLIITASFGLILLACGHAGHSDNTVSEVDSILNLARDAMGYNPEYGLEIAKQAESKIVDSIDYWNVQTTFAHYYAIIGRPDEMQIIARQIGRFANTLTDSVRRKKFLSVSYNLLGNSYNHVNNLDSVEYYFRESLFNTQNPEAKVDALINLADVCYRKGNYTEGVRNYHNALMYCDSLDETECKRFPVYMGLGQIYMNGMQDAEKADFYFRKAEVCVDTRDNYERFIFYNNRGNYYYYNNEYRSALSSFLKAKAIAAPLNAEYFLSLCNLNLADIYFRLNELDSARQCLNISKRFYQQTNDSTSLFYLATIDAAIALKKNDVVTANHLLGLYPPKKEYGANILGIRYQLVSELFAEKGNYEQAFRYGNLFRQLDDSVRSVRVKNSISEIELRYKQDTTLLKKELQIKQNEEELHAVKMSNYLLLFFSIIVLLVALTIFLFFKRKRDIQFLTYQESLSKLRLQNIRNRISPHFMFNILNRHINRQVEPHKNELLYDLVSLLRKSLEMTEDITVTLSNEIDFVESYLKLENDKLSHPLAVKWEIDSQLNTSSWWVPAMCIQIPVENALKYSVDDDKENHLIIRLYQTGNTLQIQIIDNGPGYNPELTSNKPGTGTGLKVLYGTISILNKRNKNSISFNIKNLNQGGLTGTIVELIIPEEFDYGNKKARL
jgi:tetratricopeptide (TPR) repeat protein